MNWQQRERIRNLYVIKHTGLIKRALIKQIEPVIEMIGQRQISQVEVNIDKDTLQTAFEKLYMDAGADYSVSTHDQLTGKAKKQYTEDFYREQMLNFVRLYLGDRIVSITGTSKEIAQAIIKRITEETIIPEGIGVADASRIFQREFKQNYLGTTLARARVIAQTEILTASSRGSLLGAQDAGARFKVWQTSMNFAPDGKDRHVGYPGLHGQRRAIHEDFDVRGFSGEHPGAPGLPASEAVNCNCDMYYE